MTDSNLFASFLVETSLPKIVGSVFFQPFSKFSHLHCMLSIQLTLPSILNIASIVVSLFLALHFISSKKKGSLILGVYLVLTSISVFGAEAFEQGAENIIIEFLLILCSPYLLAPLVILYTIEVTHQEHRVSTLQKTLLFLPGFIDVLINLGYTGFKGQILIGENELIYKINLFASSVFNLIIYLKGLSFLKKHTNSIKHKFSYIENKTFTWLKAFILINTSFLLIWMIDDSLIIIIGENMISHLFAEISLYATCISVFWIGFSSLRQEDLPELEESALIRITEPEQKHENSEQDLRAFSEINRILHREKLFLDPELTRQKVAQSCSKREKEITRIIKLGFENTFYHYINSLRIEHFKQIWKSEEFIHMSIEGIALESGFKSKSTFYAAFKKIEGVTPKEYERNLEAKIEELRVQ